MSNNMTYSQKWLKPIIGAVVLFGFLIPIVTWGLTTSNPHGHNIAWMSVTGALVGYALSRGKFGFAGPIKKMVQRGDGRQAKALIILFMLASIIAGASMIAFGTKAFGYPNTTPLGIGTIVGGVLFGIGMTLSTGCASGTLSDVGDGIVPAVLVLLFFMIGSVFGVTFYGSSADVTLVKDSSLPNILGVAGGIILNVVLLAVVLAGVVVFHKWRAMRGTQILVLDEEEAYLAMDAEISAEWSLRKLFSYETYRKVFASRWTWMVTVFVLVFWFAINIIAFKETPGITGAYAHWGITIFHGFGIDKANAWNKGWNIMNDTQSWQNFGIIVGAAFSGLSANKWKFMDWKMKWQNVLLYSLGGLLMGLGARLARGCNFGALFTGVSFGTGFGWVFGIFLVSSAVGTVFAMRYFKHNTPSNTFKKKGK